MNQTNVSPSVFAVLRKPIRSGTLDDASDSEEELAAFCPIVSPETELFITRGFRAAA